MANDLKHEEPAHVHANRIGTGIAAIVAAKWENARDQAKLARVLTGTDDDSADVPEDVPIDEESAGDSRCPLVHCREKTRSRRPLEPAVAFCRALSGKALTKTCHGAIFQRRSMCSP